MKIIQTIKVILIQLVCVLSLSCSANEVRNLKACENRDDSNISILLESIKLKKIVTIKENLNVVTKDKVNLLSCSLYYDNKEAFKYLLSLGADPNTAYLNGKSILHYAAQLQDVYYLQALLENGADVNKVDLKKMWKPTPLYYAVARKNIKGIQILLDNNADIDFPNSMDETPLMVAAGNLDYDTAYFLLSRGASYELKDNAGFDLKKILESTLVSYDAPLFEKKLKIISFLKNKGVDVKY